jgi:hypothetical protein
MPAPDSVLQLIQRYDEQIKSYQSARYNETETRRELIDPFFHALGWDVDNSQNFAEAYKDVIHEDAIKIGGVTKAPDYAFRIGGTRKFFVEAKKPSVNVRDDLTPAFQLRRYAWTAKLPLSILTDFEEFAIYDCRQKPDKTDKASTGRILYLNYKDYVHRWDDIAGIFSRDSILRGSFDKYAEEARGKHGTTDVDDAFLAEIEKWRDLLAHNIALRNPLLTQRELNYAVQMTVDRIIFLRICEDRGIEQYGRLQALVNGGDIYPRLISLFRYADQRYNSGLFHFNNEKGQMDSPDELTSTLQIDDRVLKDILGGLYYPESPYEFSVLPANILGQVYEQFLGKVIRLTPGHHAVVEDKPEVKKAGGVYYTPEYIVEYIVKHTVGALLEGKKPGDMGVGRGDPLRVLDPACGSGSFLLGAYQYLLDWYRDGYVADGPEKHIKGRDPVLYQAQGGDWKLTTAERKRILLDHIYGVDIDSQAVEVTKLSLLLKVLEGESDQTLQTMLDFYKERVLPNLGRNIKCGNSLIGPDFYTQGTQLALFDEEEQYRINAFDWEREFGDVFMHNGGFDAVIGNPPYVRQETLGEIFKIYAQKHYKSFIGTADLYIYFIEKSHSLLKNSGQFGMIVANKWIHTSYGKPLRNYLLNSTNILQIIDFGELPVFKSASTFPAILLTKKSPSIFQKIIFAPIKHLKFDSLENEIRIIGQEIGQESLEGDNWTLTNNQELNIFEKMRKSGVSIEEYTAKRVYFGIKTGCNEAFIIDKKIKEQIIASDSKSENLIKKFVVGDNVRKFHINFEDKYLIKIPKGFTNQRKGNIDAWVWFKNTYPAICKHLLKFESKARKRQDQGDYWWELRACDYYDLFDVPKIVYPDIAKESRATFDSEGLYFLNTVYFIPKDDKYLLGLLNSKLIFLYFKRISSVLGDADKGGRLRWFRQDVFKIPIHTIDPSNPTDVKNHDRMVALVERILSLNKQLQAAALPQQKDMLQRQIVTTDSEIDHLVYELYGLTAEEVKIVEGESDVNGTKP